MPWHLDNCENESKKERNIVANTILIVQTV